MRTHKCNCGGHPALPPAPGSVMWMPKQDDRPQLGWWAPGEYINLCRRCNEYFIGDKRAGICADCAYSPNGGEQQPLNCGKQ